MADANGQVDDPFAAILGGGAERAEPSDPSADPFRELLGGAPSVDPTTTATGAFARGAERGAIPAVGGLAGAGAGAAGGAAIGEALFPPGGGIPGAAVGAIVGGLGGGWGGAYAADRAQDYALSKLPDSWVEAIGQDDRQQRLDQEQHPYASFLGGLAPFALTMKPGGFGAAALERILANPMTSRVFGGALMGGMELGQEYAEGDVNWNKVAIATGFGLVWNKPNHFGEAIEGAIPRALGRPGSPEIIERYNAANKAISGERARAAGQTGEPNEFPQPPENEERGDLFRGRQDFGDQRLYDALTAPKIEEPPGSIADLPNYAYDQPTLMDAWAHDVGGPGSTEETFKGSAERSPQVEQAALAAQREEAATLGKEPTPDVNAVARATHPEAFQRQEELTAARDALQTLIAEDPAAEEPKARLAEIEKHLADVTEEVAAARRRAAEMQGAPIVETPAPAAPKIEPADYDAIVAAAKREVMAAGRPEQEAEMVAHLVATQIAARAERFGNALGGPLELYNREGVTFRGEGGKPVKVGGKPKPEVALEKPVPPPSAPEEAPPAAEPVPEAAEALTAPLAEPPPAPPPEPVEEPAAVEPAPETAAEPAREPRDAFVDAVKARLAGGEAPFKTILDARALAREHGLEFPEGESANKTVDELVERAVVETAREIVAQHRAEGRPEAETFARMRKLYEDQPNLSTRTSTSIAEQAYSTPAPLAYVASRLAEIGPETRVLEPTAGNGMLLMEADPRHARVNELNRARAETLKAQGFHPSIADGAAESTFADRAGQMDAVIANPPFGTVREGGKVKGYTADGFNTTQIDHAISLNALKTMKSDGRAVLIIGGIKAESEKERAAGYMGKAKRQFFHQLLSKYNVTDVFTVDGDLYAKQGAGWPVDVIVIDGKGKSARAPLTKEPPPLLKTWDEIGEKLNGRNRENDQGRNPLEQNGPAGAGAAEQVGLPASGDDLGGRPADGSGPAELEPANERPGALDGTSDSAEPGPDGSEHPIPAGEGQSAAGGGDVRRTDTEPNPNRRRPVGIDEVSDGQAPYEPASLRGVKLNTLLPANLRDATNSSLDRLERQQGPIDDYVAKALGRDPAELGKYFSAEQIDAIGLGISNIQKGEGFIIGDQTGIGKGRVVAAMISYAKRQGLVPIFVTEKPDLYGDMWRDLHDIGWNEQLGRPIQMMMTNAGVRVPLDDAALEWIAEADEAKEAGNPVPPRRGSFTDAQDAKKSSRNMGALLRGETSPDVVFTTYDQMNSVKGSETDRRAFLRAIAPRAFLIMDEAHNAGGTAKSGDEERFKDKGPPARSEVFREAVDKAHSVMYSSATYAKSPIVMTLYSKTDMSKAVENVKQLPELISKGGVPLQQVVASMLAKAGQYMRRERSFEGVTYDHENVPVSDKSYSEFTGGLRAVFQFDQMFEKERGELGNAIAAENGAGTKSDTGVGSQGAQSTSFSSIMHNVINQMIMALKAEKAAERAVQALKDGEKPVLALSKTNASFIKDYREAAGLNVGDTVNISFADILKRYLERTRRVTIEMGSGEKKHFMIPISDMSGEAQASYRAAEAALRDMDIGDLPVSPIDAIRNVIQKAGYSVREVTGRDEMLDYSDKEPMIVKRPASEYGPAGKKLTVKQFNDGKVDAVILNKSGSTGISMHASSKFADQRRRRMIIAEADPNIDTHMQMLGRVHRTGQVIPPAYTHLSADIPAEVRPTAVLMRKMASLNANTTGAAKSRFTADAVDFLNKYGDRVVQAIMREEPEMHELLGEPLSMDPKATAEGSAAKVTGRLTLLEPADQQKLLDRISENYTKLVEALDASGTNDLEAKSLDLQARVLETQTVKEPKGPSPFQGAVNLDKVSIKSQGRSFAPGEVVEKVAEAAKAKAPTGDFARDLRDLQVAGRAAQVKLIDATREAASQYGRTILSAIKDPEARERAKDKLNLDFGKLKHVAEIAHPGAVVNLRVNGEDMPGVAIGFKQKEGAKNPVALSSWEATFAMPNSSRSLGVPLSQIVTDLGEAKETNIAVTENRSVSHETLAEQFEAARKEGREDRYMFSGNVLAGFDQTGGRGQIVNHTMEDGSVRPAILMNKSFDPAKFMEDRAVRFANGEHIMRFLEQAPDGEIKSTDGIITIRKDGPAYYEFEMPAAKNKGGQYYTDRIVRDVYDNWQKKGSVMRASVHAGRAQELMDALMKIDAVFETRTQQDVATALRPEAGQELAQGEDTGVVKGRIRLRYPKRSLITLLSASDASTAVHEIGHDWLEALKRDAAHPQAPDQVRSDWETTKRWAGIGEGDKIPDAAHEKFANGFVRYLWEGVAPSQAVARVFEAFRGWLRSLFKTAEEIAAKHNIELSPEMREVYGRLLTREQRTVIAPHEEPAPALHNIHTGEAENTPPEHASAAADRIEAERPHTQEVQPPREIANEIVQALTEIEAEAESAGATGSGADAGGEASGGDAGLRKVESGGQEAGNEPGGGVVGGAGGEVGLGGDATQEPGGRVPTGGGATGRSQSNDALRDAPLAPRPVQLVGDGESAFVDKAGNFKRANINTSDDVWQAIKDRSEANENFVGDRRAPSSWEQTTQLAQAMGKAGSEKIVDGWVRGQAFNAEQIVGLVDLLQDQANEIGRLTRLKDESPEGVLAFATEQARLDMVLRTVMGATAEAGRALNIFRMMQKRYPSIDELMRAATGRTLYQKTMEMKMMAAYQTPESIAYLTGATSKHSFGRMILEYWINGLISGPATHTTYVIGNMILSAQKGFLEAPVAAALGMRRAGGNVVHFGEAAARLRAIGTGIAPALEASGQSLRTGLTGRLPGQDALKALPFQAEGAPQVAGPMLNEGATMADAKAAWFGVSRGIFDSMLSIGKMLDAAPAGERRAAPVYSPMGAIPDVRVGQAILPTGQIARLPSRAVAAIHTFFRAMNYSMEKSALTYRRAINEGGTEGLAERVAALRLNTPDDIMTAATKGATDLTLMGPAGQFVQHISRLTNWAPHIPGLGETPVLKFIDPFVHIAANVIDQSIVQRTTLGILSGEIRADLLGRNGAAAQDLAQARMIVGSALSIGFGALASQGLITGSGPSDRNKAAVWRMAGNQAHSVRIGDVWYQTNRLGPLGMLMGVSADLWDVAHVAAQGDMLAAGALLQHAFTQNVLDESFMRGPAELMQAVEDPGRYGERYIQNFASSFVPYSVGLAQIDRASDPFSRQARTVVDSIKQKVPGLSETLFPRRDIWGDPLPNHDALVAAGLTAIYEQRVSRDPVNISLAQMGIGISPVERRIRNVALTEQQYDDFARIAGRMAKQRLDVIVRSPDWQQWPVGVRADVVKEVVRQSRETARNMMFMKSPQILADATRMKMQKLGGSP